MFEYFDTSSDTTMYMYGGLALFHIFDLNMTKMYVTSTDSFQSVSLSHTFGTVSIRQSIMLGNDDLHMTINSVIKNTGSSEIRDFYCMKYDVSYRINNKFDSFRFAYCERSS